MFFLSRKIVANVTKWLASLYPYTAPLNIRANNSLFKQTEDQKLGTILINLDVLKNELKSCLHCHAGMLN